jgi:hypothetical protein
MQPLLDHQRRDRRNLNHLMPQGGWILSIQQRVAAAASLGVVLHHLIHPLDRQQLRPRSGKARLATAFAATALASHRRLVARRASAQQYPGPSLEGGLEELRELRPIRFRSWASSLAWSVSWLRSCSTSCAGQG